MWPTYNHFRDLTKASIDIFIVICINIYGKYKKKKKNDKFQQINTKKTTHMTTDKIKMQLIMESKAKTKYVRKPVSLIP